MSRKVIVPFFHVPYRHDKSYYRCLPFFFIPEHPSLPKRFGKVENLEKFDSVFFGIQPKQVHAMDCMSRMLLEHAYEAIVDAGVNPKELRGTKCGVFVGTRSSEAEKPLFSADQVCNLVHGNE